MALTPRTKGTLLGFWAGIGIFSSALAWAYIGNRFNVFNVAGALAGAFLLVLSAWRIMNPSRRSLHRSHWKE